MKGVWVNISTHSIARAKQRFGWDKQKLKQMTIEAYTLGDELPDGLKEFYITKTMPNPKHTKMIIYNDKCFVFGTREEIPKLITIYKIKL